MSERIKFDGRPPEPVRRAMAEWLRAHGVDPNQVPIDSVIERQVDERRVAYDAFTFPKDTGGGYIVQRCYVQLEAVPLPFPAEVVP